MDVNLNIIGLDAGTTTISGVLIDTAQLKLLGSKTIPNTSHLKSSQPWENLQQPEWIWEACRQLLHYFSGLCPVVDGIGITGQMHGILYLDQDGRAVSPLTTWQDERGNQVYENDQTYCETLQAATGYPMATGYGFTTHFFNVLNRVIPPHAASFCTISDYIAMRFCENRGPIIHASNAASFGCFDLRSGKFDQGALDKIGIPASFLPLVVSHEIKIGNTPNGIPVCVAIGDNQASYIGSVNSGNNLLVNIGTSSQISVMSDVLIENTSMEVRPFVGGTYLLAGPGLCGGSAYQLVRDFFAEILALCGMPQTDSEDLYLMMDEALKKGFGENELVIDTRFRGTRKTPGLRGSIQNIGMDNFTPGHLISGVLKGICNELKAFHDELPEDARNSRYVIGSGNAIRKNPSLRRMLENVFAKKVLIPRHAEEASLGAAILAASILESGRSMAQIQQIIKYEQDADAR
jgi:sedoheptulokinase